MSNVIVSLTIDPETDSAGQAIAAALRLAADYAESSIAILPTGHGAWIPETHRVTPSVTLSIPGDSVETEAYDELTERERLMAMGLL